MVSQAQSTAYLKITKTLPSKQSNQTDIAPDAAALTPTHCGKWALRSASLVVIEVRYFREVYDL